MLVVVRALYGLKSAGSSWRAALAEVLFSLGFELTREDPDVWVRAAARSDGHKYYEMLFVYVLLVTRPRKLLRRSQRFTRRRKVASGARHLSWSEY